MHIVTFMVSLSGFELSSDEDELCETFAFATTETVSIASGNRLVQTVGNVSKFCCMLYLFGLHLSYNE